MYIICLLYPWPLSVARLMVTDANGVYRRVRLIGLSGEQLKPTDG